LGKGRLISTVSFIPISCVKTFFHGEVVAPPGVVFPILSYLQRRPHVFVRVALTTLAKRVQHACVLT
jgi:hypothetical protein